MLLAIGVILLHVQAIPQAVVPATKPAAEAVHAPEAEKLMLADASISDETATPFEPGRLVLTPVVAPAAAGAAAIAPVSPAIAPAIAPIRQAASAGRVTDGMNKQWIALAAVQHGAAAFDAWSTRRAITQNGAQELNPMLKPFANNSSIYAATQIAPALLDMLGRRMMTSRHPLLRSTWWLPQALGTVASFSGAVNNMMVR